MNTAKMDTLKTGKVLTLGISAFAVLTEVVISLTTGGTGGLFPTLGILFLIYIDVEWARWIMVLRAGFGVYFGIFGVISSTFNVTWLLAVAAYLIIAWMFGKNRFVDAYIKNHQEN